MLQLLIVLAVVANAGNASAQTIECYSPAMCILDAVEIEGEIVPKKQLRACEDATATAKSVPGLIVAERKAMRAAATCTGNLESSNANNAALKMENDDLRDDLSSVGLSRWLWGAGGVVAGVVVTVLFFVVQERIQATE